MRLREDIRTITSGKKRKGAKRNVLVIRVTAMISFLSVRFSFAGYFFTISLFHWCDRYSGIMIHAFTV